MNNGKPNIDGRGGARQGAGRPAVRNCKKAYTIKLADVTVERAERFARARQLKNPDGSPNRAQGLELMIEEYALILDNEILNPGWKGRVYQRPGLKALRPAGPRDPVETRTVKTRHEPHLWPGGGHES